MVLAKVFGVAYKVLIHLLIFITEITAKIPFSKVYVKTPYLFEFILYYTVLIIICYLIKTNQFQKLLKYKYKIISIILIFILVFNLIDIIPKNNLKIYFIDVGQGEACLVVTPNNKKILIDRRRK